MPIEKNRIFRMDSDTAGRVIPFFRLWRRYRGNRTASLSRTYYYTPYAPIPLRRRGHGKSEESIQGRGSERH